MSATTTTKRLLTSTNGASFIVPYLWYHICDALFLWCLDISIEFKYIEGEAQAHRGLGICEEKVFNKFPAMQHLETALDKANSGELFDVARVISKDLVRVYQLIANEYLEQSDFEMSLQFFEKCLQVAQSAKDKDIEAECYQQIGMIYET